MSALVGLWIWPFDLETSAQCSTCHGVPSCQFWWYYYSFSIYRPLGQHDSDISRDLDLWPWKSWHLRLMWVVVLHPFTKFEVCRPCHLEDTVDGDPDFWPFDFETGLRVASKVGNLPSKFGHARRVGSRFIRYVGLCDGRTKATLIAAFPTIEDITTDDCERCDANNNSHNNRTNSFIYAQHHVDRGSCCYTSFVFIIYTRCGIITWPRS